MKTWPIILFVVTLLVPITVSAAAYVPLEPLPFVRATAGDLSFADLLNGFFQLSLVLGAAITAVMLTIGGVQYMTSDAAGGKQQGKDRIRNAALGFMLLLSVYVIIRTINPDLLVFDLSRITDVGCKQGQCVAKNTPTDRIPPALIVQDASVAPPGPEADFITYTTTYGERGFIRKNSPLCRGHLVQLRQRNISYQGECL